MEESDQFYTYIRPDTLSSYVCLFPWKIRIPEGTRLMFLQESKIEDS